MKKHSLYTTVIAALCIFSSGIAKANPAEQAKMEQAITKQIELLTKIHPLLLQVTDRASADLHAPELDRLCKEYETEKIKEDLAEQKLTDAEEDAIERKYEHMLDKLEDKVEDLAEKLYENKKGYGSDALLRAIYNIAD